MKTYDDDALPPSEVARIFGVDPKTVTRWAKAGKLSSFRTPGGHRRFKMEDVQALKQSMADTGSPDGDDHSRTL